MPGRDERRSGDEQEQGRASQQVALPTRGGVNQVAPASSLELDLPRVRGVSGEGGGAGRSPGRLSRDEEGDGNVGGLVPWTKKKNRQGRDPSTPERNRQVKDPRTPEAPVERWWVQKNTKRKEVEKEVEGKEKMKHRNLWWTQRMEQFENFLVSERKEENLEKKGKERNKSPRTKQFLGRSGIWLFLFLILMQNWFCVDAAAGRLKPQGEAEVPEIIIVVVTPTTP